MSAITPTFTTLTLAAYGWSPANWVGVFYPDDLPTAWQVSYYANEFSRLLIPAREWIAPVEQAKAWSAEVGQDFGFYVELTPELLQAAHWESVRVAIEQELAAQVLGIVADAGVVPWIPAAWLERFAVHVLPEGEWFAAMPQGAEAQIGLIRTNEVLSPQALRAIFEHLQQHTAHRDAMLFLDAPWAVLEQLRLMQQLYGV
ncbi:hypothetical protein [Thiothrix subterranea]|uniref:DUF72 domain-containing protein n=1 Tax=Thiothrix subterranea TaxID=2735563 RepID=A0ABU0YCS2_9GAMM|nr:hypothetical protein [Thiothrix subterranea]MDQ5769850.1 hypothetical protein [Thiothrix subterranea]